MILIRLSGPIRENEELKQAVYWHAFMLQPYLKDDDLALINIKLLLMIKIGGYGLDTVPGNRRCVET